MERSSSLQKTWSHDSLASPKHEVDLTRPRKHARRTSLPAHNPLWASSQGSSGGNGSGESSTLLERRRFREAIGGAGQGSPSRGPSATRRRRPASQTREEKASSERTRRLDATLEDDGHGGDDEDDEEDETTTTNDDKDESNNDETAALRRRRKGMSRRTLSEDTDGVISSTTYAAGPSGGGENGHNGLESSSDGSSSDGRHVFDWDVPHRRSSQGAAAGSAGSTSHSPSYKRTSFQSESSQKRRNGRSTASAAAPAPDARGEPSLAPHSGLLWRATKQPGSSDPSLADLATQRMQRALGKTSSGPNSTPPGRTKELPDGGIGTTEAIVTSAQQRRGAKPKRPSRQLNPMLEAAFLVAAGAWACSKLLENREDVVRVQSFEIAMIVTCSTLYYLLRSPDTFGSIWATDSRNYRSCSDDGAMSGLLLGPLLAVTCLFAAIDDPSTSRKLLASGDPLTFPPWRVEGPQNILGTRRSAPHPRLRTLALSRCNLISLQTLTSTTLLAHLLATTWIKRPHELPKSNWRRLWSFMKFSTLLSALLAVVRELAASYDVPLWTDISRVELFTTAQFYQANLYVISRLARRSFTLGELGIVSTVGVTLSVETLNLTAAKLTPATTAFVKTFRHPTPLLVFQLALVVGTFMIGFLLSPLLYLSRHLAQKPVHRLRWPHKRDLHRRLLAGFFYLFAALFVVGVLGLWVWWQLGGRNPWMWTLLFVIKGKYWWSRPLLVGYWLALVSASIAGWQATVVSGKRIRLRPGSSSTASQSATSARLVAAPPYSANEPLETTSGKAMSKVGLRSAGTDATSHGMGPTAGTVGPNPNSHMALKRAAHLSLNARRKFFHALAVLLFAPGIALDPAFTHLAFSLAFSVFIMAEYTRYYALYPFGAALHVFMSEFTDHKDSGPVILSHFYLLTGCAGTLWLEPGQGSIVQQIGVLTLGVGDALASIVGRRYGRIRWPGSSKTVEGSVAFVTSIFASACLLRLLGWCDAFSLSRFFLVTVTLGVLEGVASQNDNLVLPIYGFICIYLFDAH